MSIRETFSNLLDLAAIDEYNKHAVIPIRTEFGHVYLVACQSVYWNDSFYKFI